MKKYIILSIATLLIGTTMLIRSCSTQDNTQIMIHCQGIVNEMNKYDDTSTEWANLEKRFWLYDCGEEYKILPFTPNGM